VGDSASAFLSHSKNGKSDRVTLERVSVNEKVPIGTAGNFKTGHAPTEDPDVGRFKDDFKDWLLRAALT
jgi:hypothetical protein